MGVGMIAIVPEESADAALATLADRGVDAWVAGEITERGDHATGADADRRLREARPRRRRSGGAGRDGSTKPGPVR